MTTWLLLLLLLPPLLHSSYHRNKFCQCIKEKTNGMFCE